MSAEMWQSVTILETEEAPLYGLYETHFPSPQPTKKARIRLSDEEKKMRRTNRENARGCHARPNDHQARFEMHFDGHGHHARSHHDECDCPDDELCVNNWIDCVSATRLDTDNLEVEDD